MYLAVNGGTGGGNSTFQVDINIYSMLNISSYAIDEGGATARDFINDNAVVQVNNGGGSNYGFNGTQRIAWGYNTNFGDTSIQQSNALSFNRNGSNAVFVDGSYAGEPGAGISSNSTGYSIEQEFDILSILNADGSGFDVNFESHAEMFVYRSAGNADARFSMGPGMAGEAQLVVEYELWQAVLIVPEPSTVLLGGIAGLAFILKRRSK